MSESPFFSVLVPTYNQAQYLGSALDSLLKQTDPDWEAIIVNDGSTDPTREVIDAYCRKDSRFRAFHKENGGVSSALNVGLREAKGKWICWLSSDDLFEVKKLEIHRQWIAKYPECRFFYSHFKRLDDTTGAITYPWLKIIRDQRWQVLEMLRFNFVPGNGICVQRDAWSRAGMFNEGLRSGQDYDMWLRLMSLYPATFIPERTCIVRHHALQTSNLLPKAGRFDSAQATISFLNQHSFQELVPWVDLSNRHMACKAILKALDVATDPYAFLYELGPHPALLLRTMEWAWSGRTQEIARAIQQIIREKACVASCQHSRTALGFIWKAAAVASGLPRRQFDYQPLSAMNVAETNYWWLKRSGSKDAELLHRYLERFEDVLLTKCMVSSGRNVKEVVIICPENTHLAEPLEYGTLLVTLEIAKCLMKSGYMVLLTGLSNQGFGFIDGVLFVGAENDKSWACAVRSLVPVDALVGISRPDILKLGCARRYLNLDIEKSVSEETGLALNISCGENPESVLLDAIESSQVKTSWLQIMLCSIVQRGQIKGRLRKISNQILQSAIGHAVIVVWRQFNSTPLLAWPGIPKDLWIRWHELRRRKRRK